MARKTGRRCWGSICWSDTALASLGEPDQNKTTIKTNTQGGAGGGGWILRRRRSLGTFALWLSLVGPPSSFTSGFGFTSGLSIPESAAPPAPGTQRLCHQNRTECCVCGGHRGQTLAWGTNLVCRVTIHGSAGTHVRLQYCTILDNWYFVTWWKNVIIMTSLFYFILKCITSLWEKAVVEVGCQNKSGMFFFIVYISFIKFITSAVWDQD